MAQTLSNLPVGAKVKFGRINLNGSIEEIEWRVVAKNHAGYYAYPDNSVTLHSLYAVATQAFDAREINGTDGVHNYGRNRYDISNLNQWLNSVAEAGKWYVAQSDVDAPPTSSNVTANPYYDKAGFLNLFTENEYRAILDTDLNISYPTGGAFPTDVKKSIKVFLPSRREVGFSSSDKKDGNNWGYYSSNTSRITTKMGATSNVGWWLRTASTDNLYNVFIVNTSGASYYTTATDGSVGVRPAMNITGSLLVSDTTDSSGSYTVLWNTAPSTPSYINVPLTVYGGQSNAISWGESTDTDGNFKEYLLECSYNGSAYEEVYRGSEPNTTHEVTYGKVTVQYRVCAVDTEGATSAYCEGVIRDVINNYPPTISDADSHLGVKVKPFSQSYSVSDVENHDISIALAIDGVNVGNHTAVPFNSYAVNVDGVNWLKLSNGTHTLTITATDTYGGKSVRTYTFVKQVDTCTVENTLAYESDTRPVRVKLSITREVPVGANFAVYVCNNGFDSVPTWEDATEAVEANEAYMFENGSTSNGRWGIKVRAVLSRNNAEGACYISYIGGNFD